MDTLQKTLEKVIDDSVPTVVTELICRKLEKQGIRLSKRQKRQLKERVRQGDDSEFVFRSWRSWRFWEKREVAIEIIDQDLGAVEKALESFSEAIPGIMERIVERTSQDILDDLKNSWSRELKRQHREMRGFEKRLQKRWHQPINLLAMLRTIGLEFGEITNQRLRNSRKDKHLVEAVTRLHARSCQVASEIIALLKGGFADGAVARWRTLHEIAVIAFFLTDHGDEAAERYLLHDAVESHRAAEEYQKHCKNLGERPFDVDTLRQLREAQFATMERFGKKFKKGQYGWASKYIDKEQIWFVDIERAVGVDHLRPYYRMASHNVHANPKGVLFKLGLLDEMELLLAGPSNFGLAEPGQNTSISLVHISIALTQVDPTIDALLVARMLLSLSHEIIEQFAKVQDELANLAHED